MNDFARTHHDYFDPLKLDMPATSNPTPRGYQLTPLIYSAGPDGIWGINYAPPVMTDPYDSAGASSGQWAGANDTTMPTGSQNDNVTNHDLETRSGK